MLADRRLLPPDRETTPVRKRLAQHRSSTDRQSRVPILAQLLLSKFLAALTSHTALP